MQKTYAKEKKSTPKEEKQLKKITKEMINNF